MIPTEEQKALFREQGFFVTAPLFDEATLDALNAECERIRAETDARLQGSGSSGITHRGRRYFLPHLHDRSALCREVVTSPVLVEIAVALLGPDVRLYCNQVVLKPARQGAAFAWHQDTGYVPIEPQEYLTCWLALDDTTLANGCIRVIPGSNRWGLQPHRRDEAMGDLIGYEGPDEGIPVPLKRGQVAAFSSLTLHCSGPNTTDHPRRAYVVQYAPSQSVNPQTGERWGDNLEVAADGLLLPTG